MNDGSLIWFENRLPFNALKEDFVRVGQVFV